MQLYNYLSLMPKNEELVVFDTDYNFKTNYYKGEDGELRILFLKFADSLTVTQISAKGVTVKLASTIKENIKSLEKENLFEIYDIEYIMTLAVEPMINVGRPGVRWLDDEWTVVTEDGSLSAHYENTILVGEDGPEILSLLPSDEEKA